METKLPAVFDGQIVTVVGGGASLSGFDFSRIRQPAIAVNSSFMKCECQAVAACDPPWESKYRKELDAFDGLKISYNGRQMQSFHEVFIEPTPEPFSEDWCILKSNLSGFFALSLAFHLGASRVILLGFDGGYDGEKANHCEAIAKAPQSVCYENANEYYDVFEDSYQGRIRNVGLDSRIKSFPRVSLDSKIYDWFPNVK